jgi:hypothetical protein
VKPAGAVMTIPEAAKLVGWRRHRMARLLHRANERLGGTLLFDSTEGRGQRPRWTVSLAGMKAMAPQWFRDPEEIQLELDFAREHREQTDESLEELQARLRLLEAKIEMLVGRR